MVLEELEFQRQQEDLRRRRLEAIAEGGMRAIKTYVRTKSGRLIEKIIFVSDEDYNVSHYMHHFHTWSKCKPDCRNFDESLIKEAIHRTFFENTCQKQTLR